MLNSHNILGKREKETLLIHQTNTGGPSKKDGGLFKIDQRQFKTGNQTWYLKVYFSLARKTPGK